MNTQCFFGDFPVIDLGNVLLREITESDAEDYYAYMNRDEMKPYLTKDNFPENIEKAKQDVLYWRNLFPNKRSIYWAIATKDDNRIIGTIGFNLIVFWHNRADVSYDLNPDYWGQGIMLKSLKAVLSFADQVLGLVRIQATVMLINDRSIKALERTGFMREGVLKKYEIVSEQYSDYYMYGRINPGVM